MAPFTRTIKNDVSEFETLNRDIARYLEDNRARASVAYLVHLAVEELLLNVIKHAYSDDGVHDIELDIAADRDGAAVTIVDDGNPFDPTAAPEPDFTLDLSERRIGGLGIHLVRTLAESLEYERNGDHNRVHVRIVPDES